MFVLPQQAVFPCHFLLQQLVSSFQLLTFLGKQLVTLPIGLCLQLELPDGQLLPLHFFGELLEFVVVVFELLQLYAPLELFGLLGLDGLFPRVHQLLLSLEL